MILGHAVTLSLSQSRHRTYQRRDVRTTYLVLSQSRHRTYQRRDVRKYYVPRTCTLCTVGTHL